MLLKLSEVMGVSTDELLGKADKPGRAERGNDARLERQMKQIKKLPKKKQRFVLDMIDALIIQAQQSVRKPRP
jgi:hypothetical protein